MQPPVKRVFPTFIGYNRTYGTEPNGRGPDGRFISGWRGGPGNPYARRTAELRAVMLKQISVADLRAIVDVLVEQAKRGDLAAIKLVLDRTCGRTTAISDADDAETNSAVASEARFTEAMQILGIVPVTAAQVAEARVSRDAAKAMTSCA